MSSLILYFTAVLMLVDCFDMLESIHNKCVISFNVCEVLSLLSLT